MGKTVKYLTWASMLLFIYHMILIKKFEKPEEKFVIEGFLNFAKFIDWSIYDLRILFTKPGMSKMLPDQLQIPG